MRWPWSDSEPRGLRGWLLLVALGLVTTLIWGTQMLLQSFVPIFSEGYWDVLTDPSSDAYHPLWAPLLVFNFIGNLGFIVFAAVGLVLFFRRSPAFPKLMVVYYVGNLLVVGLFFFSSRLIPAVAAKDDPESHSALFRAIVRCVIWVPYMYRSRRVRNTFIARPMTDAIAPPPEHPAA